MSSRDLTPTVVCSTPDAWVIRISKPRLPSWPAPSWRQIRFAALLSLSLGFNIGFLV